MEIIVARPSRVAIKLDLSGRTKLMTIAELTLAPRGDGSTWAMQGLLIAKVTRAFLDMD
jgi:hypothetical protein